MAKFLYKLTDEFGSTKNNTHWSEGIKHEIAKELRDSTKPLCSKHYLHAYESPLVAVFMNNCHAKFSKPRLWLATGWVSKRDGQLKCGCFSLKIIKEIQLPKLTVAQRVRIAIYCALSHPVSNNFHTWAVDWLSGKDRTRAAAHAAYAEAADAGAAYAYAAHAAYAKAADADAHAADAEAAYASHAAYAAYAYNTYAAYAYAAYAATAYAADAAPINFVEIIKRSIKEEVAL
jgi:hypothetical protein